jgi:hypothetical protein
MQGPGLWRSWPVDCSHLSITRPASQPTSDTRVSLLGTRAQPSSDHEHDEAQRKISMSKHSARRGSKCQGSAVPMTRHAVTLGTLGRPRSETQCISGPSRCRERDRRDLGALLGRCVCVCPAAKSAKSGKREGQTCVTQGAGCCAMGVPCQRSTVEPWPTADWRCNANNPAQNLTFFANPSTHPFSQPFVTRE